MIAALRQQERGGSGGGADILYISNHYRTMIFRWRPAPLGTPNAWEPQAGSRRATTDRQDMMRGVATLENPRHPVDYRWHSWAFRVKPKRRSLLPDHYDTCRWPFEARWCPFFAPESLFWKIWKRYQRGDRIVLCVTRLTYQCTTWLYYTCFKNTRVGCAPGCIPLRQSTPTHTINTLQFPPLNAVLHTRGRPYVDKDGRLSHRYPRLRRRFGPRSNRGGGNRYCGLCR